MVSLRKSDPDHGGRTRKRKRVALDRLSPFLEHGLMRVGGRLGKAPICFETKHPVILPTNHRFTQLVVVEHHQRVRHQGMGHTWTSIREKFRIIKDGAAVRKIIGKCVFCRKRNAARGEQFMAELPSARLQVDKPPLSSVGIDYFGPYFEKQYRSMVKRFGCIFTCMTTRAVHIEIAHSLSTDSFLKAFRRFVGRRGNVEQVYSDNGTNFVGAERILKKELQRFNQH